MRGKAFIAILMFLLATAVLAQTSSPGPAPTPDPAQQRMGPPEHRMGQPGEMGMPMGMHNLMRPPMELLGQWWRNPEVVNELRLTDAQVKQLEQANLNTRLALIDAGADALKAFTRAQALLDADQFDEGAFNQQVTAISNSAASLVKNFGQAATTIRRILSAEQWKKLEALRHEHRPMMPPRPMRPARPAPPAGTPPPPSE